MHASASTTAIYIKKPSKKHSDYCLVPEEQAGTIPCTPDNLNVLLLSLNGGEAYAPTTKMSSL